MSLDQENSTSFSINSSHKRYGSIESCVSEEISDEISLSSDYFSNGGKINGILKVMCILGALLAVLILVMSNSHDYASIGKVNIMSFEMWDDVSRGLVPTIAPTRMIDRIREIHNIPVPVEETTTSPTRRVERNFLGSGVVTSNPTLEPTILANPPSAVPTPEPSHRMERHFFTTSPTAPKPTAVQRSSENVATLQPTFTEYVYYYYNKLNQQSNVAPTDIAVDVEDQSTVVVNDGISAAEADSSLTSESIATTTTSVATDTKPHIIIMLADDLGWSSIGDEDLLAPYATPFLTSMAQHGLRLSNYYSQETCTPARAALLTGRYPISLGVQMGTVESSVAWGLGKEETLLAEVLQSAGYKTHALGKWHLGHHTPLLLPTARGFDTFTGYLNGETYYWSNRNPDHAEFVDLLDSTSGCYMAYEGIDRHNYSTFFYRDHAIDIINSHDAAEPLFMYVAFQAVHDPFSDLGGAHSAGVPEEYLARDVFSKLKSSISGTKEQQYVMALSLLDAAVYDIYKTLKTREMLENSYVIFMSDNGGCFAGGGSNGPLRGTKGSLFEGGMKVDAMMYSPKLADARKGVYDKLMHVSDWFPTLLELAGVAYTAPSGFEIDGVSHAGAWMGTRAETPRSSLLLNYYTNVDTKNYDMWVNGSFAVRNQRFKLMHTFDSPLYGAWWGSDLVGTDDNLQQEGKCSVLEAVSEGEFTYFLFDLINDPNEQTNLYESTSKEVVTAKIELYNLIASYNGKAAPMTAFSQQSNMAAFDEWRDHDNYIVPFVKSEDLFFDGASYPADCFDVA